MAARVGVTPRTLQNGFRKAFNLTPAEYIRRARVDALHQALLAADAASGVTKLMTNVGIVNFGRYAQYYRAQIGVSPSTTLKQKAQYGSAAAELKPARAPTLESDFPSRS